ncbi:hypothetical protein K503DRAFT_773962 [Rhizopogon vinicolor AM-OR11-026]|uniref:Uncharacterized protein n=1 Tax=Rhizopogon vinicolor AM-OR11-026 TaxID=1314800 RepID=A0A1B7MQW0_9AGAM|nr:hypothetical protein K503DRAFT_773962 [Rhizopogon vinicolor AM-OR11-026]
MSGVIFKCLPRPSHIRCVFLDSRKHERLLVDHPFYLFVKDNLRHATESPLVIMILGNSTVKTTLHNEPQGNKVREKQR